MPDFPSSPPPGRMAGHVAPRRHGLALVMAAALTLATRAAPQDPAPTDSSTDRPNVLMVSIDTLRADHLEVYGYDRETAPNLAQLAASGVVFERCIATSNWTLPTHCSLFTGLQAAVHGVTEPDRALDPARATLGTVLDAAGYQTAGFFSNPFLGPRFGYARGMQEWRSPVTTENMPDLMERAGSPKGSVSGHRYRPPAIREKDYFAEVTSPAVTEVGLEFLADRDPDRPFFLFLHFNDAHSDYIPPAPFDWRFSEDYHGDIDGEGYAKNPRVTAKMDPADLRRIRALYDGEIASVDAHIGRILDALDEQGLSDDTLVMVTADHGEGFFEHGQKEHHYGLYDELVHVPWIVRLPGGRRGGQRIAQTCSQADVAPTLLGLLGIDGALPEADGRSWAPLIEGTGTVRPEPGVLSSALLKPMLEEQGVRLIAMRGQRLSAIARPSPGGPPEVQVYDLLKDPAELHPLPPDDPRVEAITQSMLKAHAKLLERQLPTTPGWGPLDHDEDLLEQMRAWGYIGG